MKTDADIRRQAEINNVKWGIPFFNQSCNVSPGNIMVKDDWGFCRYWQLYIEKNTWIWIMTSNTIYRYRYRVISITEFQIVLAMTASVPVFHTQEPSVKLSKTCVYTSDEFCQHDLFLLISWVYLMPHGSILLSLSISTLHLSDAVYYIWDALPEGDIVFLSSWMCRYAS